MNINTRKLRIKAKHLAEEARIIRREARNVHGLERYDLNHHRTTTVRNEARATQLAYQFLWGRRKYAEIEGPRTDVNKRIVYIDHRIRIMLKKYGEPGDVERLDDWLAGKEVALAT
ncbi:MAG: hypothetical protein DRR42_09815 [Gammaproteobacteria bacterium]|nr:MAG: hypothetical protein DRR42_09815 [Gammaproteobacteria bacterium]